VATLLTQLIVDRDDPAFARPTKPIGPVYDRATQRGDLAAGGSETVSADLTPGRYELICHLAGHYQAGQKLPFEVTG
jgi:hypothetical protein